MAKSPVIYFRSSLISSYVDILRSIPEMKGKTHCAGEGDVMIRSLFISVIFAHIIMVHIVLPSKGPLRDMVIFAHIIMVHITCS